ncbi:uncharacterized protein V1518DRAFT_374632 [Limtongia smithiae]|uniref:uncharacterized protein n=1 Tax=Limtongia smithiae TaxID=1125753 RepID=UPI0034CE00AB
MAATTKPASAETGSAEEDDEEEEDEDMYQVEFIKEHYFSKDGLMFLVKWTGYDNPEDDTWEDEDNLKDNASEVLQEYFEKIGGRPEPPSKTKKRGMETASTPSSSATKNSSTAVAPAQLPQPDFVRLDSWENKIREITSIQKTDNDQILYNVDWYEGEAPTASIQADVIYSKAPQKVIQFLARHIQFGAPSEPAS